MSCYLDKLKGEDEAIFLQTLKEILSVITTGKQAIIDALLSQNMITTALDLINDLAENSHSVILCFKILTAVDWRSDHSQLQGRCSDFEFAQLLVNRFFSEKANVSYAALIILDKWIHSCARCKELVSETNIPHSMLTFLSISSPRRYEKETLYHYEYRFRRWLIRVSDKVIILTAAVKIGMKFDPQSETKLLRVLSVLSSDLTRIEKTTTTNSPCPLDEMHCLQHRIEQLARDLNYDNEQGALTDDIPAIYFDLLTQNPPFVENVNVVWGFCRRTLLHIACEDGAISVVIHLVSHGANVNVYDRCDQTPLYLAITHGHLSIVQYLIEHGAVIDPDDYYPGVTALHIAASCGCWRIVQYLVEHAADVNSMDNDMNSPLHLACNNGSLRVVEYLINCGCNVNALDKYGRNSLHLACLNGHINIVEYLVNRGGRVNQKDDEGKTPLHYACTRADPKAVEVLIKHGASINEQDNKKQTPLHIAVKKEHLCTVKKLIQYNADMYLRDQDGRTALTIAIQQQSLPLVKVLLSKHTTQTLISLLF